LKIWDLTEGKQVFSNNLKDQPESILWDSEGDHFLVRYVKSIEVFSTSQDDPVNTISFGARLSGMTLIDKDLLMDYDKEEGKEESKRDDALVVSSN